MGAGEWSRTSQQCQVLLGSSPRGTGCSHGEGGARSAQKLSWCCGQAPRASPPGRRHTLEKSETLCVLGIYVSTWTLGTKGVRLKGGTKDSPHQALGEPRKQSSFKPRDAHEVTRQKIKRAQQTHPQADRSQSSQWDPEPHRGLGFRRTGPVLITEPAHAALALGAPHL